MARICLAIAQRLLLLAGEPPTAALEENIAEIDALQVTAELSTLWIDGGRTLANVVSAMLTPQLQPGILHQPLVHSEDVRTFVAFLVNGTKEAAPAARNA